MSEPKVIKTDDISISGTATVSWPDQEEKEREDLKNDDPDES